MDWIFLSPHLDDVALSVGGLVWELAQAGEGVAIWTICAGQPPPGVLSPFAESLHARWEADQFASESRRAEDIESCACLGAAYRHFDVPDCIYRRSPQTGQPLYDSEESLWTPIHPHEQGLVQQIGDSLRAGLPVGARLVCPLTLGDHVDHRLTRAAAERVGVPLWFYADYPYVLKTGLPAEENLQSTLTPLSSEALIAWQESIAAHRSQISTFWANLDEMKEAIAAYQRQMGGVCLWHPL
jgi:LmbE family N-acetylglucosaminyl deacetylase